MTHWSFVVAFLLRRFISDPGREVPGTLMEMRVRDSKELDDLLNYLETIH